MRSRTTLVAVALAGGLALAGCGDRPATRERAAAVSTTAVAAGSGSGGGTVAWRGINSVANQAHAGIVGTVTAVGPTLWNSRDGKPWDDTTSSVSALAYRDVTVRVERVVFDGEALDVEPGDEVAVRSLEPDGPLGAGERHLLLLVHTDLFGVEGGGTETVNQIMQGWNGNWLVDGEMATGRARTVPLDALVRRILLERELGPVPSRDLGTEDDPLAGG